MSFITRRGLFAASAAVSVTACASTPVTTTPSASAPWTPDATEIATRIRRGEMTALEAVESAIARSQALQPKLNFMVNSDFDRALDKARAAPHGPFGGVPTLVKDLNDLPGLPTRNGSAYALGLPAAQKHDDFVLRFDRAGMVVIGKSSTPEHGFLPTTEPLVFGPTRNPWDPNRSTGGSSGGSAAAVAAGIVPIAHANDGGGSIRIPASNCGLFGLKPSRGRQVRNGDDVAVTDLGVEHVVTRSVRDSAAFMSVTEKMGPDLTFPSIGFVQGPSTRRLRVGYVIENGIGGMPDANVVAAVESSAVLLRELGHAVTPTKWPIAGEQFAEDFKMLWAYGAAELLKQVKSPALLEPFTVRMAQSLSNLTPEAMNGVVERLTLTARQYDSWFESFDVILSPVLGHPPAEIGHLRGDVAYDELWERLVDYAGYTPLHNVAGAPAMSVPLFWTAGGLPVGSHFAARRGDERTLFELAYELERARPWAGRRPPISIL